METMLHQENVFLNVLIIEDSAEDVELIVLELRRAGYSPRWRRVDSASQLSSALNDGTWHVILCDYTMSNFTAGEALRIVQAKGVKAPFIIVSATILDESALELMRSGARDIVMKSSLTRIEGAVRRELSDLASRKDAERAASASRQELVTMLESIGDAFIAFDHGWRYTYLNQKAAELSGKTRDELLGRNVWEVFPQAVGNTFYSELHRVVAEKQHRHFEEFYPAIDRWLEADAFPSERGIALFIRDSTARRQAETALRESEQRFALFMKNLPGAAWMKDVRGCYVYANVEAERIFHTPLDDLCGKTDDEIFPPETAAQFKRNDRRAITSGETLQTIETLPQEDGLHYSIVSKFPIVGSDGQTTLVGGVAIDITNQKKAEEALRDSEESYRIVAETAGDGIVKINETSEILFANGAALDIFGYTCADLIGQPLTKLMPEYLRHLHKAALRSYSDTGVKHINWSGTELPGLHKNGREVPLEISFGEFLKDGKHIFTGIIRDITQRKRHERHLAAQHAVTRILSEYSSLSDIAPRVLQELGKALDWSMGGFWTVDQSEKIVRCVETWSAQSKTPSEFQDHCRECKFKIGVGLPGRVWQSASAAWIPDVTNDTNFPRAPFAVRERLHAAFGFPILLGSEVLAIIEFFSSEIREPDTQLLQLLDVIGSQMGQFLERKRLEEQIRQTQKLESIGVLAGGVAHDFNNLLTGVKGNASLVRDTLPPAHPSRPFLEDVIRATDSAAHLTRQLLAYAGKGRFVLRPINLSELAREMTHLIQTSIPKTVHLRLQLSEELPSVEGDTSQLQQLVMNLVINGAEAIGEGKNGSVLVVTGTQDVDESYVRKFAPGTIHEGRYVFMEVQDTGSGMDRETLSKIFDPFFTTKFSGRGLGLAAVTGIIRAHNGAMDVYSAPGEGTRFKVLIPPTAEPAAKLKPEAIVRDLTGRGTILIVDDEEIVRRTAGHMLKQQGYDVIFAANGQEAVDIYHKGWAEISLVLLDLTMPVMSGEVTLRKLQNIRPEIKVVLSSGYNELEALQRFASKDLAGFIQKPYTAQQLAQKVKSVLEEESLH